jgi:hypothetical protein
MATATAPAPPRAADANAADPSSSDETRLSYLARQTSACTLAPRAFFVSWQGVLTLAYSGFPPQLASLKASLAEAHGEALPKESPGSRWPKTSLGCMRDGRRLTPEELQTLLRACREESAALFGCGGGQEGGGSAGEAAAFLSVTVRDLSVLTYECRSLERVVARQRLPLLGGENGGRCGVDFSPPSKEEAERVAAVLAEADDPDYWYHASRDGGREAHYRGAAPGVTLVHELAGGGGRPKNEDVHTVLAAVRRFRARVDAELPGVYAWFDERSLHVTVRAIIV